uniref:Uncharacterized protein n=1 Tax=Pseudomonas fluorescens (strain SBW25) TaxID=216595 RepID=A0A0G4E526_PSEFS|nr:hypothetical protein [Pseudomonas fluorescens]CEK42336.1 hypothetical protein PQBR57_0383 [Pseudomonas fluorescens SBW25]
MTKSVPTKQPSRIVKAGRLKKRLISTIRAAVRTSEVAHTCDWLVSEGYASDIAHACELVNAAFEPPLAKAVEAMNSTVKTTMRVAENG